MTPSAAATKAAALEAALASQSVEPNSAIYAASVKIASQALGQDISPAVGVIDPSVYALINLIAEWIIKILQALRERMNPDDAVAVMRRPGWLWKRRIAAQISDDVRTDPRAAKFKGKAYKLCDCLFQTGERIDESTIRDGFEELEADDFILV